MKEKTKTSSNIKQHKQKHLTGAKNQSSKAKGAFEKSVFSSW